MIPDTKAYHLLMIQDGGTLVDVGSFQSPITAGNVARDKAMATEHPIMIVKLSLIGDEGKWMVMDHQATVAWDGYTANNYNQGSWDIVGTRYQMFAPPHELDVLPLADPE